MIKNQYIIRKSLFAVAFDFGWFCGDWAVFFFFFIISMKAHSGELRKCRTGQLGTGWFGPHCNLHQLLPANWKWWNVWTPHSPLPLVQGPDRECCRLADWPERWPRFMECYFSLCPLTSLPDIISVLVPQPNFKSCWMRSSGSSSPSLNWNAAGAWWGGLCGGPSLKPPWMFHV